MLFEYPRLSRRSILWPLAFGLWFTAQCGFAAPLQIAVASNFTPTARILIEAFRQLSPSDHVSLSSGSSGKLYAQIVNGAPFDIFLSADQEKPLRLLEKNLAVRGSHFSYAQGVLVLWGGNDRHEALTQSTLSSAIFEHLAIAQPKLAPYGRASIQVLERLGLGKSLLSKLVYGENTSQAYQFTRSGAASFGFIPLSFIGPEMIASVWIVPYALYDPIYQDAVLLNRGKDKLPAQKFMTFLRSDKARKIIEASGYRSQQTTELNLES